MFFGNQVTCEYWDYVWLNEGFASYLEYTIADKVRDKLEIKVFIFSSPATQNLKFLLDSSSLAHDGLCFS